MYIPRTSTEGHEEWQANRDNLYRKGKKIKATDKSTGTPPLSLSGKMTSALATKAYSEIANASLN